MVHNGLVLLAGGPIALCPVTEADSSKKEEHIFVCRYCTVHVNGSYYSGLFRNCKTSLQQRRSIHALMVVHFGHTDRHLRQIIQD
jgi:hypothetical protein